MVTLSHILVDRCSNGKLFVVVYNDRRKVDVSFEREKKGEHSLNSGCCLNSPLSAEIENRWLT